MVVVTAIWLFGIVDGEDSAASRHFVWGGDESDDRLKPVSDAGGLSAS
jgi:hypothetical protein